MLAGADDVELAEHVVQLRASAEDSRPGAERRRQRRGHARPRRRPRRASCPAAGRRREGRTRPRSPAPRPRESVRPPRRAARGCARRPPRRARASASRGSGTRARSISSGAGAATRYARRSSASSGRSSATAAAPTSRTRSSVGHEVGRAHARGVAVDPSATLLAQQDPVEDPVQERARLVAHEACAREVDGGRDELGPLSRREAPMGFLEPREQTRERRPIPSPMWKTCVPESPKSIRTSSISPSRVAGTPKKQSSTVVSPPGSCTSRNPPPAGPVSGPSVTNAVKAAASSASTAFPPSRSTRAPASAVRGWPAAIAPRIAGGYFGSAVVRRACAR